MGDEFRTDDHFQDDDVAPSEQWVEPNIEDFIPSPPRPLGPLEVLPHDRTFFWASLSLLLCTGFSLIYWFTPYAESLALSKESFFRDHEYWRAVTALFVHADIAHLLSNMPFLALFAWVTSIFFGAWLYPALAVMLGIFAHICTVYFSAENMYLVGASGLVYVLYGMWLVYYMRYATHLPPLGRIIRVIGFFLVMVMPSSYHPSTSYLAHSFGFLFGVIGGLISLPFLRIKSKQIL